MLILPDMLLIIHWPLLVLSRNFMMYESHLLMFPITWKYKNGLIVLQCSLKRHLANHERILEMYHRIAKNRKKKVLFSLRFHY